MKIKLSGVKSNMSIFIKGAENFAKLSGVSFAMLFGDISPNIRTMTVVTAVDMTAPLFGNQPVNMTVATDARVILTMLLPISIVESRES